MYLLEPEYLVSNLSSTECYLVDSGQWHIAFFPLLSLFEKWG